MWKENVATPKISVIMSVYNSEKFLCEAIDSILAQTFKDFEFIILDDSSTDQSVEIIKKYSDPRIRFIQNEKNLGLRDSLNRGLELAEGEYIARMDSDDIADVERLEKQVAYMDKNPHVVLCGGNVRYLIDGETRKNKEIFPLTFAGIRLAMLRYNCFFHPTVIIRRSFLVENKLNYQRTFADDYDLWIRMIKAAEKNDYTMVNIPEVVLNYRIHESNFGKKKQEISNEVFQIQKEYLESLDLTLEEKKILRKAYEGNADGVDGIKEAGAVLLKCRNMLHDKTEDTGELQNIVSKHYYEICYLYAGLGLPVFILFCKSKVMNYVKTGWYIKLFLKCGFKGRIHKLNRV